jgi:hypothetical protein
MRCAITAAEEQASQYQSNEEPVDTTYKKNLESPLQAALIRAPLSDGFLGIGLQKAKGSNRLISSVK